MSSESSSIQSVRRAIDVLFCFDRDSVTLTANDVGARLGMNRSTAWRYLRTLAETGIIREVDSAGHFALGPQTLRLAENYGSPWRNAAALATPALVSLRDATGETAALHVRSGNSRLAVTQVESRQELHRTYRDIGESVSLLRGAPSMAILALFPADELDGYLDGQLDGAEDQRTKIDSDLRSIRERGYAVSRESRTANVASVAAPILVGDGLQMASVNVSGPLDRFTESAVETFSIAVARAAKAIQAQLNRALVQPRPPVDVVDESAEAVVPLGL